LRFDFSHPEKLSPDQITQVENFINRIVTSDLPVTRLEMPKADAFHHLTGKRHGRDNGPREPRVGMGLNLVCDDIA
jgi:alanyl-tRNA synthetase